MTAVFTKLNLKDQKQILILNPPASFEPEIAGLDGVTVIRDLKAAKDIPFVLAFITKKNEIEKLAPAITKKAQGDAVVWFAYPKKTSKNYTTDIDRDSGWQPLGDAGFEAVRMVAIDEDWSAKRYRRPDYIKVLTRDASWAMTKAGKAKANKISK